MKRHRWSAVDDLADEILRARDESAAATAGGYLRAPAAAPPATAPATSPAWPTASAPSRALERHRRTGTRKQPAADGCAEDRQPRPTKPKKGK